MNATRKFRGIDIDTSQEAYLVVDEVAEIMADYPTDADRELNEDELAEKAAHLGLQLIAGERLAYP